MLPVSRRFWVRRPSAARRANVSRPPGRGRNAFRPAVEALEPRQTPTVTFAPQQTLAVGNGPEGMVAADINGDGRPDLIVTNFDDNAVSVLLNTTPTGSGTASYSAQQTFAVGALPSAVAVADFNGDGRPDLAVVNNLDKTVSVLLNTTPAGSTTLSFATQKTFAVGTGPQAVAAADFNGDGRPDLVVSNLNANTVSVLLNTTPAGSATPSFAAQQTFAVGSAPWGLAVADVNGDGRPDLAVANNADKTVSVLLDTTPAGSGTPTFAPQQTFAVGGHPLEVAVADFNGDGRPDLAVANFFDNTVSVLLNETPAGTGIPLFANQQTFAVGTQPFGVAAADFNGDGRPDLAVTNQGGNSVSVLLNGTPAGASTLSFATQQTFAVGSGPSAVAAADFNGDGRPDLAVINQGDKTVSVLLDTTPAGAGTPSFAAQKTFAVGNLPAGVVAADLDGDGRPDLAVTNQIDATVSVLLDATPAGATTPTFAAQKTFVVGSQPIGVAAADLNGDGRPDLVTANINATSASVLLDTTAPFPFTTPVVVGAFGSTGVWEFNRATNTWVQIGTGTARSLAADPLGDVAGAFGSAGVWLFKPSTGFKQIGTGNASLLAMDALGDVAGEFPGAGVWLFRPAVGFQQIGTGNASALAMDAQGDVVGTFPKAGVWLFRPAVGFQQLGASDASVLTMDALGDVIGTFPGAGIWEFRPSVGFQQINTADAAALAADPYGDVVASFAGVGVGQYQPTVGWQMILPVSAAALGIDALGDVFGEFAGFGVWQAGEFRFVTQLQAADASVLVVA
jgi:hypothetical protein